MKKTIQAVLFLFFVFSCYLIAVDSAFSFNFGKAFEKVLKNQDSIIKAVSIGKKSVKAFSDFNEEEQYYVGRSVGAHLLAKYKLSGKNSLSDYVSNIGQTLALASERPDTFKGYHFILLDEPRKVNAFSVPSGFIFISTGLISKASNEDELAGILAHEISHNVYYHPTNSIKKAYRDQLKKEIFSFAADQVTKEHKNNMIKGLVTRLNQLSEMLIDNAARGYSREKETEADRMAVEIMITAGYDPRALAKVLEKLNPVGTGNTGTHGNPVERSREVMNITKKIESSLALSNSRTKRFNLVMKSRNEQ